MHAIVPHATEVPPNSRAYDYEGAQQPPAPPEPAGPSNPPIPLHPAAYSAPQHETSDLLRDAHSEIDAHAERLRLRAAQVAATLEPFGSHGPVPQPHELVPPPIADNNPFGDFFSDGPSAWLEDDDEQEGIVITERRLLGTVLALTSILMLAASWGFWGWGMYRGAGGAEAGGFLLIAMLSWIWYLSLPRDKQHRFMLRWHARVTGAVDRRIAPLRARTEGQLVMRRERDRYRAMRDERTRRIDALGETAFRAFRQGTLPAELHTGAQRVLAIERQMLAQDHRIHELVDQGEGDRANAAADPPNDGHDPA